uniref:Interleukin-1 n=1 Tax=Sarcophilus harrisii TaxID=9305 RepID=A0A7N4V1V8_SARHA
MARVPDIYEDLHLQYSDNEEFISDTHHVSSSQDSFYTNSSPYQEESCTKLEISEKIHQLNSQDCVDAPVVKKKKEKKKQISESHPITSNYVFNVGSNLDKHKGVFDIGRYVTLQPAPNYGMAVTIRIANTQLFVAAKGENEPVELQELPKTPTTLDSTSQFLFYWKTEGNYSTFASLAYPGLFLATDVKDDELVFLAKGLPALTAFLVVDQ